MFYEKLPSHTSTPQISVARWPKTFVELEKCIGAECVRKITRERELCVFVRRGGIFIECVGNVDNEKIIEGERMTKV